MNLDPQIVKIFYLAVFLLIIFAIFSLTLIFNAHLAQGFLNWLSRIRILKRFFKEESLENFRAFIEKEIKYFKEGITVLLNSKRYLIAVIIFTFFYWTFYYSLAPILLIGLGLEIVIPPIILAQLVFSFIQAIIPTPGGSGGAELGFAYLFKFMVPNYLLGIFVAIWRFFMFYASLIIGGLFFIKLVQGTAYLE